MATKKPSGNTKARVLLDCSYGKVNDVIDISPEDLSVAEASGQVDTHPDAVSYAESLKAE